MSLATQIRTRIALQIADAELAPGDRLPSVRSLAGELGVNVNTVRAAYAKLEADGLVGTRQGIGSVVLARHRGAAGWRRRVRANTIAVLIAGLNPFYLPLLGGIEDAANERGALVLIADSRDSPQSRRCHDPSPDRARSGRHHRGLGRLHAGPVPTDGVARLPRSCTSTSPSGADTAWSSTGPARVTPPHATSSTTGTTGSACVTAPLTWPNVAEVHRGYLKALGDAGHAPHPSSCPRCLSSAPKPAARPWPGCSTARSPAAVFAAASNLALGAISEARLGAARPGRLAIVGYTDRLSALVDPPLTIVEVPVREIGLRWGNAPAVRPDRGQETTPPAHRA